MCEVAPGSTMTVWVLLPTCSCHAAMLNVPGGTLSSTNRPSSSGLAKYGWSSTITTTLIYEWRSQNTLTMPVVSSVRLRLIPRSYRTRSNDAVCDNEKTL